MPRLDGLRGIAVIGVLVEHFAPSRIVKFSPGGAGVTLFFVLSGYLITRIILNYRDEGVPTSCAAAHFYWRRFLRLSPPYYIAIIVAGTIGLLHVQDTWFIHAAYLTNFLIASSGKWLCGADHFWSLCTEEQFYLLWFFVVMLIPKRYLLSAIIASFLTTLAFRLFVYVFHLPPLVTVLLPGNLASLSMGALLAHSLTPEGLGFIRRAALDRRRLIASGLLFVAGSISIPFVRLPSAIFYPFFCSLFFACIVFSSAERRPDCWLDWLKYKPLVYCGKISYGIVVYHLFLPDIMKRSELLSKFLNLGWFTFVILCAASIGIAHVSWVLMERPLLRLKDVVTLPSVRGENVIPRSRHDPKILWVDDAEIVGDRITKVRPIPRNLFTQKTERRIGELGASCVALVVSDVSVHEAP